MKIHNMINIPGRSDIAFFIIAALICPFLSIGQQHQYDVTPNGLRYKMFTHEKGPKPVPRDVVKFNFELRSEKDSVIVSTFRSLFPVETQVRHSIYKGDLEEAFMMLSKGDSGVFLVSADSFYSTQPSMPVPSGTMLRMTIKMLDILSEEDYKKEVQKNEKEDAEMIEKIRNQEIKNFDIYIKDKASNAQSTADGLYYLINRKGKGALPKDSQTIIIRYSRHLLDGRLIDSNNIETIVLGRHNVIKGLEEGVALLNSGSRARLFIPSALAYGDKSAGSLILPYTSLVYDLEIIEIK